MSLVVDPKFQHILRVLNTNIDGKTNVMFALTSIKGIGRRYANIVLKKADIPLTKRAGELSEEDVEKIITIMQVFAYQTFEFFSCICLLESSPIQDSRLVP